MPRPKHLVGDYWESKSGLGFTVTEVTDDALVVEVERNARDKDGRQHVVKNTRTVRLGYHFDRFSSAYRKQRKKSPQ